MPMASHLLPSEPHTVGPMPGVSVGPMTTAPAPSPSRKEMVRSVVVDDVGELLGADHQDVVGGAGADQRVAPGRCRSSSRRRRRRCRRPGPGWRRAGRRGSRRRTGSAYGLVTVETITASSWEASMPAFCDGLRAAPSARSTTLTSAGARCRVMMPVRWRIHSSEESIHWQTSSLVTITLGPVGADAQDAGVCAARGPASEWERSCRSLQFCK